MITVNRRRRAIARTREDILEAAARAFTRAGYASATMRDIAREAGYTAASLYTYFKSKDEILAGLLARSIEGFLEVFEEPVPAGLSFRQKLELISRRHLGLAERQRDLFSLFVTLGADCAPPRAKGGRQGPHWVMELQIKRLADWFRTNATEEDLGGHDPVDAALVLISIGHGFLHAWMARGFPEGGLTRQVDLILDFFVHGVTGQRDARPSHAAKTGGGK
jgi:AcrR family transcriptional regulator